MFRFYNAPPKVSFISKNNPGGTKNMFMYDVLFGNLPTNLSVDITTNIFESELVITNGHWVVGMFADPNRYTAFLKTEMFLKKYYMTNISSFEEIDFAEKFSDNKSYLYFNDKLLECLYRDRRERLLKKYNAGADEMLYTDKIFSFVKRNNKYESDVKHGDSIKAYQSLIKKWNTMYEPLITLHKVIHEQFESNFTPSSDSD